MRGQVPMKGNIMGVQIKLLYKKIRLKLRK